MTPAMLLLLVLMVMLIGAVPTWSYSRDWGYLPSGGLGLVVLGVVLLLLFGRV